MARLCTHSDLCMREASNWCNIHQVAELGTWQMDIYYTENQQYITSLSIMTIKSKLIHIQNSNIPLLFRTQHRISFSKQEVQDQLFQLSQSSSCSTHTNYSRWSGFPHAWSLILIHHLTKLAGGNNERQWEVHGEFTSVNLALALGERRDRRDGTHRTWHLQKNFEVAITVLICSFNVYW